jgi:myo-inositol-1(or 4)-monophosphatase
MNLEKITGQVVSLCQNNAAYIRQQLELLKAKDIELKDEHNFVTYVDRKSEEMLVEELSRIVPGSGFIAEESKYGPESASLKWVIDPLDGTTNFIHGVPIFSISVALMQDQEVILGVVHEINRSESFYSWKGSKAFLNGKEIRVSSAATLYDSLLVTGFPYKRDDILDRYVDLFKGFIKKTQDLRRLGSAAADLAFVASGRFEGFYEIGLSPWDVAAGVFLVRQAGGNVTDFHGRDDYIFGKSLVSSNGLVHREMLEVVEEYFMGASG